MHRPNPIVSLAAALALSIGLPAIASAGSPGSAKPAGQAWAARPATYGVVTQTDVRVLMSDGVRLDVDVRRPAGPDGKPAPGKFPVVLTQTPYNKNSPRLNFASDYLVSRGYIQVISDIRGTGGSEGSWDSFGPMEQADGKELVEWAATELAGSTGKVALHGTSYGAIIALLTAAQQPKGLTALFPIVPSGDVYRDIVGSGGQVNVSFIPLWLGLVTGASILPPTYAANDPLGAATAVAAHGGNVNAFQLRLMYQAVTGGATAFDGPFYRMRSPLEVVSKIKAPTFVIGGWFDLFQRGEPMIYQRLRAQGTPTRLLMGPWTHLQAGTGVGLPADSVPTLDELELRWFDHYTRGNVDTGLDRDIPQVRYFENGAGHYRSATSWPPAGIHYRSIPLGGSSTVGGTVGTLGSPGQMTAGDALPYLPVTGVCTRSTTQWTSGADAGSGNPCETNNRFNDLLGLQYDLPVATKALHVAGPITAKLYVSTTAKDGALTARLEDVAPDGTSTQYTAGWQVLSLRALDKGKSLWRNGLLAQAYHPFTQDSVLAVSPAEIMEVDVEIFGSGFVIQPGHRLRLALQAADTPHFLAPTGQAVNQLGGLLAVWHYAAYPSSINLPVLG